MTAPMIPGQAAASSPKANPQRAAEPARHLWSITTCAPGGRRVAIEVVDHDEVDERIGALTFATEHLPGWTVSAEPIRDNET